MLVHAPAHPADGLNDLLTGKGDVYVSSGCSGLLMDSSMLAGLWLLLMNSSMLAGLSVGHKQA